MDHFGPNLKIPAKHGTTFYSTVTKSQTKRQAYWNIIPCTDQTALSIVTQLYLYKDFSVSFCEPFIHRTGFQLIWLSFVCDEMMYKPLLHPACGVMLIWDGIYTGSVGWLLPGRKELWWPLKHTEAETIWPPFFRRPLMKFGLLNDNMRVYIKLSLRFAPEDPIYKVPALVQIMSWLALKPWFQSMIVRIPVHICYVICVPGNHLDARSLSWCQYAA